MCNPQKCPRCGRTGWAGCGRHVDDVMRSVPPTQRCTCTNDPTAGPPPDRTRRWWRR